MRFLKVTNATRETVLAERAGAATNSRERRTGLLKHTSLPQGGGLWIAPCEAVHTFGMKFAIDLVFIDRKHRVVKVRENVPRRRIAAALAADSVIELPAGAIARTGTRKGDQLQFEETQDGGAAEAPNPQA